MFLFAGNATCPPFSLHKPKAKSAGLDAIVFPTTVSAGGTYVSTASIHHATPGKAVPVIPLIVDPKAWGAVIVKRAQAKHITRVKSNDNVTGAGSLGQKKMLPKAGPKRSVVQAL